MICVPSEDSDQDGHPPSLIRVFAVRMKKAWVLSYPLRIDWAHAQADLSLRGTHRSFCGAHMPFWWFCHEAAQLLPTYFHGGPKMKFMHFTNITSLNIMVLNQSKLSRRFGRNGEHCRP